MYIRAYLRASTDQQDAQRAREQLDQFARERGLSVAAWYAENESGASLRRPELFRLLADCSAGDILLIEQVDRLTRLSSKDWDTLKADLQRRRVKVVALDLPTSWQMATETRDDITSRIFEAINSMMMDVLAAVARKDYEDRRRRQVQGIEKAKRLDRYKGRPEDTERNAALTRMLESGQSWNTIVAATGASRSTLARLARKLKRAPSGSEAWR